MVGLDRAQIGRRGGRGRLGSRHGHGRRGHLCHRNPDFDAGCLGGIKGRLRGRNVRLRRSHIPLGRCDNTVQTGHFGLGIGDAGLQARHLVLCCGHGGRRGVCRRLRGIHDTFLCRHGILCREVGGTCRLGCVQRLLCSGQIGLCR
ncbi:MAG: hypothetical protein NXI27_29850, partial [Alphaproteobacteria bacterium]|nr:hypothetical protein [Alphaproteobacteria bacterium]